MGYSDLPKCPVETTLLMIGQRWKALIIRDLLTGTKRFGELKKSVKGITQKVLTTTLRNLEKEGIVTRKVYNTIPPKVEYTLTDVGYSLLPVLNAMASWGTDYQYFVKLLEKQNKNSN